MTLTTDKIKQYWIGNPVTNKPNNKIAADAGLARYNDSLRVYDIIKFMLDNEGPATNLTKVSTVSTVDIVSSTGSDVTLDAATTTVAGVMSAADKVELASLRSVVGNNGNDLDTFTGTIIPDDSTIKQALQALESAISTNLNYSLVDGGSHTVQNTKLIYARPSTSSVTINLGSSMQELVPYYILARPVSGNTVTLQPNSIVLWVSGSGTESSLSSVVLSTEFNRAYVAIRYGGIVFLLNFA